MKWTSLAWFFAVVAIVPAGADVASYLGRAFPEGAALVIHGGKTVYANRDEGPVYQIGSITKVFTAVAILQLVEQGRLRLDAPVSDFVDYPDGTDITVEHLLCHQTGIPDFFTEVPFVADWKAFARQPHTLTELVGLLNDYHPTFAPGTQFRYSNSNYLLLGRILEVVTGVDYQDWVTREILEPTQMTSTGVMVYPEGAVQALGNAKDHQVTNENIIDLSFYSAAGGMVSTAADLGRFAQALVSGQLVSADTLRAMNTDRGGGYGLGWMTGAGLFSGGHTGLTLGFASLFFVDSRTILVLLSNDEDTRVDQIADNVKLILRKEALLAANG